VSRLSDVELAYYNIRIGKATLYEWFESTGEETKITVLVKKKKGRTELFSALFFI